MKENYKEITVSKDAPENFIHWEGRATFMGEKDGLWWFKGPTTEFMVSKNDMRFTPELGKEYDFKIDV